MGSMDGACARVRQWSPMRWAKAYPIFIKNPVPRSPQRLFGSVNVVRPWMLFGFSFTVYCSISIRPLNLVAPRGAGSHFVRRPFHYYHRHNHSFARKNEKGKKAKQHRKHPLHEPISWRNGWAVLVGRLCTLAAHGERSATVVVIIFHEATKTRRKKETFMGTEIMWVDLETEKLLIYILCDLDIAVPIVGRSLLRNILLTTACNGTGSERASGHAFAIYAQGTAPEQTTILDKNNLNAPSASASD